MATAVDTSTIGAINNAVTPNPAANSQSTTAPKKAQSLGKDEFLKLLIAQLKNQDPLKPADGTEFVAQLAQFSSLERLISIDESLGSTNSGGVNQGVSSLASYLGTEVTLNSDQVTVENGEGGSVRFNLPNGAAGARLEFSGADGQVLGTADLGSMEKGEHQVALSGLDLSNGSYKVTLKGTGPSGAALNVPVNVVGIVTGFAPGEPPQFFMGSRQFGFGEIQKVEVPRQG